MKKTKLLLLLLLLNLVFLKSNAQSILPTTIEEYNYITKGYKTMIESGLDMKKGYSFKELGSYTSSPRKGSFKALYRDNQSKPCGILCIFQRLDGGICYICIPTFDAPQELWNKTMNDVNSCFDNAGASKTFNIFLMKLISELSK